MLIVLVLAAVMLRPSPPAAAPAASTFSTERARTAKSAKDAAAQKQSGPVAPVKLAELEAARQQPGDEKRNPFRFQPKAAPKPIVTAAPPPPPPVEAPRPVVTGPPPPPPVPPITLKLIGVLERANGVKWAVLSDGKTPTPFYGKDGDIIDGRYQIVKIGTESIEMTYANGQGKTVIRLTGQ